MTYRSFESEFEGILAKHDANARKSLSHYAYHKLWLSTIKLSQRLQCETNDVSSFYTVWPVGETQKEGNSHIIKKGYKCGCHFQHSFECPCAHEFAIGIAFEIGQYSPRWLNNRTYKEIYLSNSDYSTT